MKDVNYLKVNGFNIDSVINSFIDIEVYNEVLNDFLSEDTIEKLLTFKANRDMTNYAIVVHNLKGECMYLGIERLANIAFEHQLKSEDNDLIYINDNFETLISELRRVNNVIKIYLGIV